MGMTHLHAEVIRRGEPAIRRECLRYLRAALPYRTTDWRARIVIRANVNTLRDLSLIA